MRLKLAAKMRLALPVALAALASVSLSAVRAAGPEGGAREIVIEARKFSYEPAIIRVAEGQRVRITLSAMDVTHGLYLEGFGLEIRAVPGSPEQLEFIADRPGQYSFRCTQTCGSLHPFMVGRLIVTPNLPFNTSLVMTALVSLALLGHHWLRRETPSVPVSGGSTVAAPWMANRRKVPGGARTGPVYFDFLKLPIIGPFLRWRGFQFAVVLPFLLFFMLALVAGWRGSPVGSHNLAVAFVWMVWWVVLIILLIPLGGRLWCAVCPVPGPGEWLQRFALVRKRHGRLLTLGRKWPPKLRTIWLQSAAFLSIALFSALVITSPAATAAVLGAFFALSLIMSLVFEGRTFCRYVCPLGGFIGLCSLVAPLALRVKDKETCRRHQEKECIRGSAQGYGCPWFEYPGAMDRNAYCGLCMECVKTCPKGNIAFGLQAFGRDLVADKGRLDEAYRVFIALASAAIYSAVMLGPWGWLKSLAGNPLAPGFGIYGALLLGSSLIVLPGIFLAAVWLSRLASGAGHLPLIQLWKSLSYGLVPLAVMVWIAFSLSLALGSGYHAIPVVSDPLGRGWDILGTAGFEGRPVLMGLLPYLQIASLLVGLVWSIETSWQIARGALPKRPQALRALVPIILFMSGATATFLWLCLG